MISHSKKMKPREKEGKISVSIMCADLLNLEQNILRLEENGVDYLHVDVTDGHFVPNLTFGPDFIKAMHEHTALPLDIHLMVENPELMLTRFDLRANDILSVHVELNHNFQQISEKVHAQGALFGLAINPETPIQAIAPYLSVVDVVILMLVHPGFASGTLVDGIIDKVEQTRHYLNEQGHENILISVDGSVNCERARQMANMGANIFVGGTAGIYRKGYVVDQTIPVFREAISTR